MVGVLLDQIINYFFLFLLQIRSQKEYYVADPEVDSLVSIFILLIIIKKD